MTSSNENIFHVTGPLCGEFPAQSTVTRSFAVFFDLRLDKRLNNEIREAGDLRRYRTHYDVIVKNKRGNSNIRNVDVWVTPHQQELGSWGST